MLEHAQTGNYAARIFSKETGFNTKRKKKWIPDSIRLKESTSNDLQLN
jgi:hypothetical protein